MSESKRKIFTGVQKAKVALKRLRGLIPSMRLGSKHYTISAIPLSQQDWKRHFQPFWGKLVIAKHSFDPDNILTSGPGIFADNNIEVR